MVPIELDRRPIHAPMHIEYANLPPVYSIYVCAKLAAMDASRFWDRRAAAYSRKPVPDARAYEQTLARVRAQLTPNDRVLELGCGTGTTAIELASSAREILATDYSAQMLAIARTKAERAGVSQVSFRRCTLDDESLAVGSFDVVMAMNLLHLLTDLPARLSRIAELVRAGGRFISKTPCIGDQGLALRVAIPLLRTVGLAPFVNYVTERSLVAQLEAAGFVLEETAMLPKKSRSFFVVARRLE